MRIATCLICLLAAAACGTANTAEPGDSGLLDSKPTPSTDDAEDGGGSTTDTGSSDEGTGPSNDAGPSSDGTGPSSDAGRCAPILWKATSTHVSLRSFGFFVGSSGYDADRASLTADQLQALDGLCLMPAPTQFASDGLIHNVQITDEDGSVAEYVAAQSDLFDRDYGLPTISISTLDPFLKTFKCLAAGQTRDRVPGGNDPPWSQAPDVNVDPSCRNGIFMPYQCRQVWLKLNVPAAATHRLALERCYATMGLKVFTPDAMTELAASDLVTGTTCAALSYAFAAGTYLVRIDKANGTASCDGGEGTTAGDFYLRIDGAPPQPFK
jgi:hypothetical protein